LEKGGKKIGKGKSIPLKKILLLSSSQDWKRKEKKKTLRRKEPQKGGFLNPSRSQGEEKKEKVSKIFLIY